MACDSNGGGGCGVLKSEKQNEQQKEAMTDTLKREVELMAMYSDGEDAEVDDE